MKIFKSIDALEKAIMSAAEKAIMSDSVVNVVKQEIANKENEMVYGGYSPSFYNRRFSLGKQFSVKKTGPYSIRVEDIAPPNYSVFNTPYPGPPGAFAQWINDGAVPNYFNSRAYAWAGPRPFYQAAEASLQNSAALKSAVINGIKSHI